MIASSPEQPNRVYAKPAEGHVSLGRGVRQVLFFVPMVVLFALLFLGLAPRQRPAGLTAGVVVAVVWGVVVGGVRVAAEWERGVILQLGKIQDVRGPGLLYVVPVLESVQFIDTRTLVINIPRQKAITRVRMPIQQRLQPLG